MPEAETLRRARADKKAGKPASTQAGEFVREEMHHVREGKHGARSPEQAIAIGLSKARRSGVKLPAPSRRPAGALTRRRAELDLKKGRSRSRGGTSARRSRSQVSALRREGRQAASQGALWRHARAVARRKSPPARSAADEQAAHTRHRAE